MAPASWRWFVRQVESDRSVGFRNDLTVLRAIGRFGFAVLYPSAAVRIKDIA